jgi:hypothetical protein
MDKELLSRFLSKNTASIIIEYLTDPPPLPFNQELIRKTFKIRNHIDQCWFYNSGCVYTRDRRKDRVSPVIRHYVGQRSFKRIPVDIWDISLMP